MDDQIQKEILEELRSINAHHERVTKNTRRSLWVLLGFLAIAIFASGALTAKLESIGEIPSKEEKWDWYDSYHAIETGEIEMGIKIGETLILKNQNYAYGHIRLGELYNMDGQLDRARDEFRAACEILPTERNLGYLRAIEKKIGKSNDKNK